MIQFEALIKKFGQKGEKTGWTYIEITTEWATQLSESKVAFRVKGKLDEYPIKLVALVPMGEGDFILPLNAQMRKFIKKNVGEKLTATLELDTDPLPQSDDLLACLEDEPAALERFLAMPKSHQNYYSKWVESAKTIETKSKRIRMTIFGMKNDMAYGDVIRYFRENGVS